MLNFHLHHLSNMGMWETGKHVHYVQCAVYVQYMYVRQSSTYSSTVRAVMSHRYFPCIYIRVVQFEVAFKCLRSAGSSQLLIQVDRLSTKLLFIAWHTKD